jgi:hypothetical protein
MDAAIVYRRWSILETQNEYTIGCTSHLAIDAHSHCHQHNLCLGAFDSAVSDRRNANTAGDDDVLLLPVTVVLYHRFAPMQLLLADKSVIAARYSAMRGESIWGRPIYQPPAVLVASYALQAPCRLRLEATGSIAARRRHAHVSHSGSLRFGWFSFVSRRPQLLQCAFIHSSSAVSSALL